MLTERSVATILRKINYEAGMAENEIKTELTRDKLSEAQDFAATMVYHAINKLSFWQGLLFAFGKSIFDLEREALRSRTFDASNAYNADNLNEYLRVAAYFGDNQAVARLLDVGADITQRDNLGRDAIIYLALGSNDGASCKCFMGGSSHDEVAREIRRRYQEYFNESLFQQDKYGFSPMAYAHVIKSDDSGDRKMLPIRLIEMVKPTATPEDKKQDLIDGINDVARQVAQLNGDGHMHSGRVIEERMVKLRRAVWQGEQVNFGMND